jgi:hypothetical protein
MRRITYLLVLVGVLSIAATGGTARASGGLLNGNCGSTQQVFAPWQDYASYYFASNGGFENGTSGWNISGSTALNGANDPYHLSGPGDTSLTLGRGSTASINVCYGFTYPAVRFVAAGVGGPATIHVRVVAHNLLGLLSILDGGTFTVPAGWDAAPKLSTLFSALIAPLGTKSMELRITVENGTAQIDDLFVDPWLTKA